MKILRYNLRRSIKRVMLGVIVREMTIKLSLHSWVSPRPSMKQQLLLAERFFSGKTRTRRYLLMYHRQRAQAYQLRVPNSVTPGCQYYLLNLFPLTMLAICHSFSLIYIYIRTLFSSLTPQGYIRPSEESPKINFMLCSW